MAHDAGWGNSVVYFVHTLRTRKRINLGRAVKRLLDAEVAQAAAWPSEDAVRVAPSLAAIDRPAAKLRRIHDWLQEPTWSSTWRIAVRHPAAVAHILWVGVRHSGQEAPVAQNERANGLADSLQEIESMLFSQQKLLIAERQFERDLFGGEPGGEDAFVRLELRPTRHRVVLGGRERDLEINPRLLLHRDGIVQVIVPVALPAGVTTDDLVRAAQPDMGLLKHSEFPAPFAESDESWVGGEWAPEPEAGVRVRVFEHEEPVSAYDWLDAVVPRILSVIHARDTGHVLCYPVVLAEAGSCCSDWGDVHGQDIARLATRTLPVESEELLVGPGPNLGISSGAHVYANLASALIIELRAWQASATDLHYTLLFERIALLYMRLSALEVSIGNFETKPRDIRRTYQAALELEQEARGARIRAGTARDIASHVLGSMGVPAMLDVIGRGMTMLGERAATRASEKAARTANRFAAAGLLAALVAVAPAIPGILQFVADQRAANPDVSAWGVVQDLVTSPLQLAVLALSAVVIFAVLWFAFFVVRVARVLNSWRKRGWISRIRGYEVVVVDTRERG